jgi:hypothetical protein
MAKDEQKRKKRKDKKKKVDPNKPKRALSSFMHFSQAKRPELKVQFPDMKVSETGKKLGELWKAITPEEKKVKYQM